eukprot:821894-Amphidinium_carterae.1
MDQMITKYGQEWSCFCYNGRTPCSCFGTVESLMDTTIEDNHQKHDCSQEWWHRFPSVRMDLHHILSPNSVSADLRAVRVWTRRLLAGQVTWPLDGSLWNNALKAGRGRA